MRGIEYRPSDVSRGAASAAARTRYALHCISLVAALLALSTAPARATTVVAKGVPELCNEADKIFVATVSSVRSQWTDPAQTGIETFVTFAAPRMLLGSHDGEDITLRFGGGAVDGIREEFLGAPRFAVGDRVVVFVQDGYWVSPIVGFNQGCFHIEEGDNGPVVLTADRRPVTSVSGTPLPAGGAAGVGAAVTLDEFLDRVRDELNSQGRAVPR